MIAKDRGLESPLNPQAGKPAPRGSAGIHVAVSIPVACAPPDFVNFHEVVLVGFSDGLESWNWEYWVSYG